MSRNTQHPSAAGPYARALLELASEAGQAQPLGEELRQLKDVILANPAFADFLRDPAITQDQRRAVLERAFAAQVSGLLMNALRVLNVKGRLGLIPAIAATYQTLLDQQLGNVRVQVTVAQPLDAPMLEQVQRRIGRALKMNATVNQLVDESIIGGMVLNVNDRLIDGSVRAQLDAIKRHLMAAAPR